MVILSRSYGQILESVALPSISARHWGHYYEEKVELTKKNIDQALRDYAAHTDLTEHLDNVTNDFIDRLARDSVAAKQDLRNLFRKSPVWDEQLDTLVINGTRTHNPDYNLICG